MPKHQSLFVEHEEQPAHNEVDVAQTPMTHDLFKHIENARKVANTTTEQSREEQ